MDILVKNPAYYWRHAPVEIDLEKVKNELGLSGTVKEEDVILKYDGEIVPFQIDDLYRINNTPKQVLTFLAIVEGNSSKTFTLYKTDSPVNHNFNTLCSCDPVCDDWDFQFKNDKINIYFHRGRVPIGRDAWCAGSATAGWVNHWWESIDLLKTYGPIWDHSSNRCSFARAMQMDQFRVFKPSGAREQEPHYPADKDYKLESYKKEGPIRAFLSIRYPFSLEDKNVKYKCNLYRILYIYPWTHYLLEDAFIKAQSKGKASTIDLKFQPTYGCHIHHHKFEIFREHDSWKVGWAQVADKKLLGLGFGSNTPVAYENHPCRCEHSFFDLRWTLEPTKKVRCLHLLLEEETNTEVLIDATGKTWYDAIYHPLSVEVI